MRQALRALALVSLLSAPLALLAGAREEILVRVRPGPGRATIHELVSRSDRFVAVRVEGRERCGGDAPRNARHVRDHVLAPGEVKALGETRPEAGCELSFAVVEAEYL